MCNILTRKSFATHTKMLFPFFFESNILLHDIVLTSPMICRPNNMDIRPVRLTIADLQQEM